VAGTPHLQLCVIQQPVPSKTGKERLMTSMDRAILLVRAGASVQVIFLDAKIAS
jgi:hypothetical protein